jgi:hypothetical protein
MRDFVLEKKIFSLVYRIYFLLDKNAKRDDCSLLIRYKQYSSTRFDDDDVNAKGSALNIRLLNSDPLQKKHLEGGTGIKKNIRRVEDFLRWRLFGCRQKFGTLFQEIQLDCVFKERICGIVKKKSSKSIRFTLRQLLNRSKLYFLYVK